MSHKGKDSKSNLLGFFALFEALALFIMELCPKRYIALMRRDGLSLPYALRLHFVIHGIVCAVRLSTLVVYSSLS